MINFIRKNVPETIKKYFRRIRDFFQDKYFVKSYSQEGEDMVLRRVFEHQETGFYVDVGAHHPKRFSNTYYFYKKSWRGINIDAMPGSMDEFNKVRTRDINIECPISEKPQLLTYYAFDEPALNGFSKCISFQRNNDTAYNIIFTKDMETATLESVFDRHLPPLTRIDFLSVDVEGLDFSVLKSNNWNKYAPQVILVEILGRCIEDVLDSEITAYLKGFGYEIFSKTVNTVFYRQRSCSEKLS